MGINHDHSEHHKINSEMIIIITQAFLLIVSEVMPFCRGQAAGIADWVIKCVNSECCEEAQVWTPPDYLTEGERIDAEAALKANEDNNLNV